MPIDGSDRHWLVDNLNKRGISHVVFVLWQTTGKLPTEFVLGDRYRPTAEQQRKNEEFKKQLRLISLFEKIHSHNSVPVPIYFDPSYSGEEQAKVFYLGAKE